MNFREMLLAKHLFGSGSSSPGGGGGSSGGVDGADVFKSGKIVFAQPVTTSYTIEFENEYEEKNSEYTFFILFRCDGRDERGISTIGYLDEIAWSSAGGAMFGGYVGGTGSNNNNLNEHSISRTMEGRLMQYTITCNAYAPLSAHTYIWLFLSKKEGGLV